VTSELDTIPGIGEKSKQALITHFRSVKRLKSATKEEISEIIGNNKASIIYTYFHPNLRL
jgi:excinuclease ABC subunit C